MGGWAAAGRGDGMRDGEERRENERKEPAGEKEAVKDAEGRAAAGALSVFR